MNGEAKAIACCPRWAWHVSAARLPGPFAHFCLLSVELSVELRALVRAAGWLDSREDLAVVWWQLHRLKVTFAGAYDVEGNAHAPS